MASEMIAAQQTCAGLLKFILPDNTVTVYLEVMTLTGVYVYKRAKSCIKMVLPMEQGEYTSSRIFKEC